MYSRILDIETYARVVAALPVNVPTPRMLVRRTVIILSAAMGNGQHTTELHDGSVCYEMGVSALAECLGADISPKQAGLVLRDLGLPKKRCRDGYWFFWSREQVDILMEALGMADEPVGFHVPSLAEEGV